LALLPATGQAQGEGPSWSPIHHRPDFNGDGKADLFVRDPGSGSTYFAYSNGAGFGSFQPLFFAGGFNFVEFTDFNNDSRTDIFVRNSGNGSTFFALANAGGGFDPFVDISYGSRFQDPIFMDFNGDGKADFFVRDQVAGQGYIRQSNGAGFDPFIPIHFASNFNQIEFANFDGDPQEKIDILVRDTTSGQTYVTFSNGAGFDAFLPVAIAPHFNKVKVSDFDGDLAKDLFVRDTTTGESYISHGSVSGFGAFFNASFAPAFNMIEVGEDFHGDGMNDLLVRNSVNGDSFLAKANGTAFDAFQNYSFSPAFNEVEFGDFDGNGMTDLFIRDNQGGQSYIRLADGAGFGPFLPIHYGANFGRYQIHDFGGPAAPAKDDLFVRDELSGQSYVAYSNGAGFDPFVPVHFASRFNRVAFADFNGDSLWDLFVRDPATGNSFINQGGATAFQGFLGASFAPNFNKIWPQEWRNSPPPGQGVHLVLLNPRPGATFNATESLLLDGFGTDQNNGILPGSNVEWRSDVDGLLGSGSTISTLLTTGTHTIFGKATDPGGGPSFMETQFPIHIVPVGSPEDILLDVLKAHMNDIVGILNSSSNIFAPGSIDPTFLHIMAIQPEIEGALIGFRTEENMRPGSVTIALSSGFELQPFPGVNMQALVPGDIVRCSWTAPSLNWIHDATGDSRQCGVDIFRDTEMRWDGSKWLVRGNQDFGYRTSLEFVLNEDNSWWDVSLDLSVTTMGSTTPSGIEVEGPFLQGAVSSPGMPRPEDFDATSDQSGRVPLVTVMEDGKPAQKIRLHLGQYLSGRPHDAERLLRDLQGRDFFFKVPVLPAGFRDVPIKAHFGFDPGYFLQEMDVVPPGAPGLLNPVRMPNFNLDTTALVGGGGPGTLGVNMTNRTTMIPLIGQDQRGDMGTESMPLAIVAECRDPANPALDSQSYSVVTSAGAGYDVSLWYCDSGESCLTRQRHFVAP
jgi:hypothetical protein